MKKCSCSKAKATKQILNHLKSTRSVAGTKQLHARVVTLGLDSSSRLASNLSRSYALAGHVTLARQLFDHLPQTSSQLVSSLMRMYLQKSLYRDALTVFRDEKVVPDDFTLPFALKACAHLGSGAGAAVHARALTSGCSSDSFVGTSVVSMYVNFKDVESARKVFDEMPERGVAAWNALILGFSRNGLAEESVALFRRMRRECCGGFNSATAVAALPACGVTRNFAVGREIHSLMERDGFERNARAYNALIDMYSRCREMREARDVFDKLTRIERDVVAWTSLINGYIMNGDENEAVTLFGLMLYEGVSPNSVTLSLLLSACRADVGKILHCLVLRRRLDDDVFVDTALIDMYAKDGMIKQSLKAFSMAKRHDETALWSAVIAGCTQNGLAREAIKRFREMTRHESNSVRPVDATIGGLINSYAVLADLAQAKAIHGYIAKTGIVSTVEIATGLVDVYSKCGSFESSCKVFDEIHERTKDIFTWGAMIACCGRHGEGSTAVLLYNRMVWSGLKPNEITLTSVLNACSHSGLVDEGLQIFNDALGLRKLKLKADHYACVVDLLGRSGRLEEAHELIQRMGTEHHAVWGAMLGACVTHQNVELGEIAAERLFQLEPDNTGNYILMAKIYASVGRFEDAENVRQLVCDIGLVKSPAHSLIGVRNI